MVASRFIRVTRGKLAFYKSDIPWCVYTTFLSIRPSMATSLLPYVGCCEERRIERGVQMSRTLMSFALDEHPEVEPWVPWWFYFSLLRTAITVLHSGCTC